MSATEGDFWNNLDSFVEKQNSDKEKVGDWLNKFPSPEKSQKLKKASNQ